MTLSCIQEERLGALRWIIARGSRHQVFEAVGLLLHDAIARTLAIYPELKSLERFTATPEGEKLYAGIKDATIRHCASEWQELSALAQGAGVDVDELLLFNLRGDLGLASTYGCSDLAWAGADPILAHNEDGLAWFENECLLLTLVIDGEAPVTAFCYPGLMPSNAFVVHGSGLIWSIDHLGVADPPVAPGRHFVARRAQRCGSLLTALDTLRRTPSAGGFAYMVGDAVSQSVTVLEVGANRISEVTSVTDQPQWLWHANNMRYLHGVSEVSDAESNARSGRLAAWCAQSGYPDVNEMVRILAHPADSSALYRSAISPDPLLTLCSMVCELGSGMLTVVPRGGDAVRIPIAALTTDLTASP